MYFKSLLINIRFYILISSIGFSILAYFYITNTLEGPLQIIRLTQLYALTAVTFLYLALLAGPFCYTFRWFPFRAQYLKGRRAIGVSAFYFGLLHASFAFFGQLGGFGGLGFLSGKYLLAIFLSFTALVILFLMATTSFDFMVAKLTFPKWKMLHRFVYLAGIFILIHALMLGTHFQDLSEKIPQALFIALAFLFVLESKRADAFLQKRFAFSPNLGIVTLITAGLIIAGLIYFVIPNSSEGRLSLGIHAAHIQLAKQAQQDLNNPVLPNNIPGLQGDRTRRFTVSFLHTSNVQPNTDIPLTFQVFDAQSGNQVQLFQRVYEKVIHLIIVDSELKYFNHIHPEQKDQNFEITTQFPHPGQYHLYINFQPLGAIEQQFAFTLNVGNFDQTIISNTQPDTVLTKESGKYEVSLDYPKPLQAQALSVGKQTLSFTIKNANTKQPITTLKPYLAAFGHLVMINEQTFDYLHVHPSNLVPPPADSNGGPKVEFLPLGLYGPIKPGVYRIFAQFNPDNNLFVSDFTIKVE